VVAPPVHLAGEDVDLRDAFDLVAEPLDPEGPLGLRRRHHLEDVAAYPEGATPEGEVVALVMDPDQAAHHLVPVAAHAGTQRDAQIAVVLGRAEAEDARHAGDDDHVAALEQRRGGAVAQFVDLVVDRRVLLDVGVGGRQVGLGLVVVVIRHKVLDRVVREEFLELARQLGRERLVVGDHQRGPVHGGDRRGDRERLAAAGHPEEDLRPGAGP
jgi:hypothetical protein